MSNIRIRRRIFDKKTGKTKTIIEEVELVEKRDKTVVVRLGNKDLIKRKLKDIVEE